MIKQFSIALCLVFSSCVMSKGVNLLKNKELKYNDTGRPQEQLKSRVFKGNIVNSNIYKGNKLEYLYNCKNIRNYVPETFFASSRNLTSFSGKYDLLNNYLVAEASCSSDRKIFEEDTVQSLFLESCAKSAVLALVESLEEESGRKIDVEYIQWCIVKESEESITLKEIVKFFETK